VKVPGATVCGKTVPPSAGLRQLTARLFDPGLDIKQLLERPEPVAQVAEQLGRETAELLSLSRHRQEGDLAEYQPPVHLPPPLRGSGP
jgi:hypothetical protein